MRTPSATDFTVDVPEVGSFSFARRMMRDEIRIAVEYSKLTEGVETPTVWLDTIATWLSTLKVLTVRSPEDWDLDGMDPQDEETYRKLLLVHRALREKEGSFRRPANPVGTAGGAAAG